MLLEQKIKSCARQNLGSFGQINLKPLILHFCSKIAQNYAFEKA
jgi:hypothetical protein